MNINVLHCDGYEPNSCFFFRKTKQIQVRRTVTGTKTPGGKSHSNQSIQRKLLGDSIIKNIERFAPKYFTLFPASTVLNAGIPGDTVEAILYRVLHMSFPLTVTCISLLCGTNNLSSHSPATISATVMEILFVLRQKCPTCVIHFLIYQGLISSSLMYVLLTLKFIFMLKIFLQTSYFMTCHLHYSIETYTGKTNFT